MHTLTSSSNLTNRRLLDSKTPLRLRASRFLSDRYAQREQPGVAAEFILFAVVVLIAVWPMFTLAHVLGLSR